MGTIGDLTGLLEKLPAWRRLSRLPAEIEQLQERIARLEQQLDPATGDICPKCKLAQYRLIESRPESSPFGDMGAREHLYRCSSCGFEDVRRQA